MNLKSFSLLLASIALVPSVLADTLTEGTPVTLAFDQAFSSPTADKGDKIWVPS